MSCILVVAAHPDDEVLGCGGTIARLTAEGSSAFIAILGEGITSRYSERENVNRGVIANLHEHSRQVAQLFGASDPYFFNLPDNRFDTLPLLNIIKVIEELITRIKPDIIYTHHSSDLNIDHAVTSRAVLTATRPVGPESVREIYAFEVPSSTEWSFGQIHPVFQPNVFMDISTTMAVKIKAMQQYQSELQNFPHPRSLKAITTLGRRWGSAVGLEAAEAFMLVRKIG